MSLTAQEQTTTARELRANLDATGLTADEVAVDLGWAIARFHSTLAVDGPSRPEDVWLLRDYLAQVLADVDRAVTPFTVLTESSRALAVTWFTLQQPPHHDFSR